MDNGAACLSRAQYRVTWSAAFSLSQRKHGVHRIYLAVSRKTYTCLCVHCLFSWSYHTVSLLINFIPSQWWYPDIPVLYLKGHVRIMPNSFLDVSVFKSNWCPEERLWCVGSLRMTLSTWLCHCVCCYFTLNLNIRTNSILCRSEKTPDVKWTRYSLTDSSA